MLNIDGLSFCIISDANVMDIFMFNYCTVLYSVMLVIAAVFVFIVVIIPPPCIFMLEPVLTKLFSWNCWNIKVTYHYTKIRMSFMPFLDSFQGCFKDKYRFFAGLYFHTVQQSLQQFSLNQYFLVMFLWR